MRTIVMATELAAPAEVVWSAMKTPQAFVHVAGSMLRYPVAERLGRPWRVGDQLTGWTFLGGVLPFSRHHLHVVRIDDDERVLATNERGGAVKRWDHELRAEPLGERRCTYEDRITIDAGLLTPLIVAFAHLFYRYRQRRWRAMAPLLATVVPTRPSPAGPAAAESSPRR